MKKLLVLIAAVAAVVMVVPAWAAKPSHHKAHPSHPAHPVHGTKTHSSKGKGKALGPCKVVTKGYRASGTLVSATLTPGAKKDHYDGTLTVDVTRANHKATEGTQSFTLTDARVRFGKGVSSTSTAVGDRVTVHGKMTTMRKGCSSSTFTSTITVHNARISAPKK